MISLKQLHYALAVEKTLHFKRAADACFVSPSTLSNALTEMEKQLGLQIFERDNKKVLVTELGSQVLEKAQAIMLQIDNIQHLAETQQAPLSRPMSIGIIPTIAPYLLPIVLPAINREYPELQLTIIEGQSEMLAGQVKRGEIDTAILALPYELEGLLTFTFWQEDFYWITHKDHSLAGRDKISAGELDQVQLILLQDGHCLKDQILDTCMISGNSYHSVTASSLETLIQLVAGKMGTTLVPQMALATLMAAHKSLCSVHLSERGPHRELTMIMRPTYAGVKNIELLKALFNRQLSTQFG
jgi:LysR family hydrogen peroxide-inducible transcriptional activator